MTIEEYLSSDDEQLFRIGFQLIKTSEAFTFDEKYFMLYRHWVHVYWSDPDWYSYTTKRFDIGLIGRVYKDNSKNL